MRIKPESPPGINPGGADSVRNQNIGAAGERPTVEDIRCWLAVIHPDSHAIELRAPKTRPPKTSGEINVVKRFAPGAFAEAAGAAYKLSGHAPAVYLVMNGIDP